MAIGPAASGWLKLDIKNAASLDGAPDGSRGAFFVVRLRLEVAPATQGSQMAVAYGLAGPVMLVTISRRLSAVAFCFELAWGPSLLIGAILAPTDPVLASLVQVNDARDDDSVRFGLSGEAGLNDGIAFPFVILGLLFLQQGDASAARGLMTGRSSAVCCGRCRPGC
jgi:NhaP-type Na+/H+ or K+/H+ antiporter